ncbi:hypothetical protein AK812_SmicGene47148 [Symbiodinium microadriaticum]|uniref:Uncharacterized protein n=1 Tax=Symbiodinium microadriaticum TaxID=2951 RepID=A0A1Q9BSC1_SYMMI|nr:hypothetical protein AK812_SmicGene47148 [Symbiodinium microadriaticum]
MRLSAVCTGHDSNVKMCIHPTGWKFGEIQESRASCLVRQILADPLTFCVLAVLLWRAWRLLLPDGSHATFISKVRVALPAAGKTLQSLQWAGIIFLVDRSMQTAPSPRGALRRTASLKGFGHEACMDTDKTSDDEIIRSCTSTSAQAPAHSPAAENSGDLPRHRMKRQLARALKLNAAQTLRACGNAGPWF